MPPMEDALASYLTMVETSMLKSPVLPSKLWWVASQLNNRVYTAVGQASGQNKLAAAAVSRAMVAMERHLFSNLSWGPTTAQFGCFPHLTHPIQLLQSLLIS